MPSSKLPSSQDRRLTGALHKSGHLLVNALAKDPSPEALSLMPLPEPERAERIVRSLMERADPTNKKRFTAWLVREYAAGRLILEDLGTANETLTLFQRYAPRLKPEQRDIQRYGSLAAAWEAVRGFAEREEAHSNKAQKALDRVKAYEESRILCQAPDGFTVAAPMTEFAAKWWGRGTRWCTAAEKDNQFRAYHQAAPLIVIVIPELKEHGKFQIWEDRAGYLEFMNARNEPISDKVIVDNWNRLEGVLRALIMHNGRALCAVPEPVQTSELCRLAVKQNCQVIRHVPANLLDYELYKNAIKQDGLLLSFVPKEMRSEELCRIAVQNNGRALQYVPNHLKTKEICYAATRESGRALSHVPIDQQTEELCQIAVTQNGLLIERIPPKLLNDKMCLLAVENAGIALVHIPPPMRNEELYRIAFAQYGVRLEDIPEHRRLGELFRLALARDGWLLSVIPEDLITEELCLVAIEQQPGALVHVPEHLHAKIKLVALTPLPEVKRRWEPAILDHLAHAMTPYRPSQALPNSWIMRKLASIGMRLRAVASPKKAQQGLDL